MANLCIAGSMAVNGVSALHSEILRKDLFKDACQMMPDKFKNVTNGIDHRRWVPQINPGLDGLLRARYNSLRGIVNGIAFAAFARKHQGVVLNTDAIFDVQVKRLHEYKRQLLNALQIIYLYQRLQDDPSLDLPPQTSLFGAKAAPGYAVAKRIIHLINSLADQINSAWQKECSLFFSVEEVEQDEFDARIAAGKYTIALAPIRAEGGSVYQMLQQFTAEGGSLTGYADTVYADRLALSAQQTGKDRCALLAQCERQLLESCTVVPLMAQQKRLLLANGVRDLVFDPFFPVLDMTWAKMS